eukprot:COSAG04_NODE_5480_length_1601_cov_1.990013_2_plen_183_part_00
MPAVSWPWVPAWGSLEPSRRGGENAQKTGKNGGKMGEIRPKKCEGRELTKDQLAPRTLSARCSSSTRPGGSQSRRSQVILPTAPGVSNEGGSSELLPSCCRGLLEPSRRGGENAQKTRKNGEQTGEIRPKKCEVSSANQGSTGSAPLAGAGHGIRDGGDGGRACRLRPGRVSCAPCVPNTRS